MPTRPFIVGAYASLPKAPEQRAYYTLLANQPWINGLEIPYPGLLATDPVALSEVIAPNWDTCTVTAIPGTMQTLLHQTDFGLASPFEEGRQEAIRFTRSIANSVAQLHEACGRAVVTRVQLHSAPCEVGQPDALEASLSEISQFDWSGAVPVIEHCDAFVSEQTPEKGFLCLEDEIDVAQATGVKIHINWGRSAIEGRSATTPLEHVINARDCGVLAGVFFSGAGPVETIYGYPWIDGHLPATPDEPSSLMTEDTIAQVVREALNGADAGSYFGAKICVPQTSSLNERISMIKTIYQIVLNSSSLLP